MLDSFAAAKSPSAGNIAAVQYSGRSGSTAMANPYSVPSVGRAMMILELLAQSQRGLTLSDVSRRLGIPKSSAHVLVKTLEAMGYLKSSKSNGRYCFGLKLVSLSNTALENLDMREQARPYLQQLMLRTGLTVHLAILEGAEAVIIEKVEAPGMLRLATWVGRRLDANSSGVRESSPCILSRWELCAAICWTSHGKAQQEHDLLARTACARTEKSTRAGLRV